MKYLVVAAITLVLWSCGNKKTNDDNIISTIESEVVDNEANDNQESENNTSVSDVEFTTSNAGKVVKLSGNAFISNIFDFKTKKEWDFNGTAPCIVDFYADWCGPCKQVAPIMDDLAKIYEKQINIYKVDVDKENDLAMAFDVQSIPAIMFCPMEGDPLMYVGAYSKKDYEELINEHLLTK
jgi:thioredoxin